MTDYEQHTPEAIERVGDSAIRITWSDGLTTQWTVSELRKACPCATCREKHGKIAANSDDGDRAGQPKKPMLLPVLSAAEARPLRIDAMQPVGTYAYNVQFSDGHHSGIYTFARLRREAVDGPTYS